MSLIEYSQNLNRFSKNLPFDYIQFLEAFESFMIYYKNSNRNEEVQEVYDSYKHITTYIIRLNSKLIDGMMLYLIPDRLPEFEAIVVHRKERVFEYYQRNLLDIDEMQSILLMIDNDRMSILNQAIWSRIYIVNNNPTFKGINNVVKFAKNLQFKLPDIDIKEVYKWRSRVRKGIVLNALCLG